PGGTADLSLPALAGQAAGRGVAAGPAWLLTGAVVRYTRGAPRPGGSPTPCPRPLHRRGHGGRPGRPCHASSASTDSPVVPQWDDASGRDPTQRAGILVPAAGAGRVAAP